MSEILITSSVLILALLIMRKLFRNSLSRRVQYALWALVLIRLLIPVNLPAMDFSVLTAAKPVEQTMTENLAAQPVYIPVGLGLREEHPAVFDRIPEQVGTPVGESVWVAQAGQQTAVQYQSISVQTALTWIWLAGCGVSVAFLLFANLRFWLWLRRVRKPWEAEGCNLPVYLVQTGLPSPCLFGLFRPAIYLTPAGLESEDRLRHILAHEMTHAQHFDHLWTFLRGVCLAVYWFDPLVWVAASAAKEDCELACDEGALARLEEADRIPYGKTLLSLIPVRKAENPMLAATTMAAGKKQLKDRVARIAEKSRQTAAALAAVALLTVTVSACTFTGGVVSAEPAPDDGQTVVDPVSTPAPAESNGEPDREPDDPSETVIPLSDLKLYEAPAVTVTPRRVDFTEEDCLIDTVIDGHNLVVYRSSDGTVNAGIREGDTVNVFRANLDLDTYAEPFSNIFGQNGFSLLYFGQIGEEPELQGRCMDYYSFGEDGSPVLLARLMEPEDWLPCDDLDGDGSIELFSPRTGLLFRRDGQIYQADVFGSVLDACEGMTQWSSCTVDHENKCLVLKYTLDSLLDDGVGTVTRNASRRIYFDGEQLILRKVETTYHDHMVDGADEGIPADVVTAARNYVEQEVIVAQPDGTWRHAGYQSTNYPQETYDDWRIERMFYLTTETVDGVTVNVWGFNYELHVVDPEKVVLAGGTYLTEDFWVSPGYPGADWLFFRAEGGEYTYLWHDMVNSMSTDTDAFREYLAKKLAELQ